MSKNLEDLLKEALEKQSKTEHYLPVNSIHIRNYDWCGDDSKPFGWTVDVDQDGNPLGIKTHHSGW